MQMREMDHQTRYSNQTFKTREENDDLYIEGYFQFLDLFMSYGQEQQKALIKMPLMEL